METNKRNNARMTSAERMYNAQQYANETYDLSLDDVSANLTGSDHHRSYSVLTGFDTFEQAQDVASKFGLEIRLLSRRDGQHTWKDMDLVSEALQPMEMRHRYDEDLVDRYQKGSDTVADIVKVLYDTIEGMDDEEAVGFVKHYNDIIEEFVDLEDGAWVAVDGLTGRVETFEDKAMECSDGDVTRYVIGVTDGGREIPETEDEE